MRNSELLGSIIGGVIEKVGDLIERRSIARALRAAADDIERGDIVPDDVLERARERAKTIAETREQYKPG